MVFSKVFKRSLAFSGQGLPALGNTRIIEENVRARVVKCLNTVHSVSEWCGVNYCLRL
jgi:hypothetical protein